MKSRDALIRLKRFEVEEKRRKVVDIEAMIGEFNHMAVDLDRQIAIPRRVFGRERRFDICTRNPAFYA